MTSKQESKKESLQSVAASVAVTTNKSKRRRITLVALLLAVSLTVAIAIEIGFAASFLHGYVSTAGTYKHSLCTAKVLGLSQKGVIRDAAGFDGAIHECVQMNYINSIYGNVFSTTQPVSY